MKTIFFAALLLLAGSHAFAQEKEFSASSAANSVLDQGVDVTITYILPADDPLVVASKTDPAMRPARIIFFWGDEAVGAKMKSYSEMAYTGSATTKHTYKKAGIYGITVLVNDAKNRNIRQASLQVKISLPFEIYHPALR